MYGYLSTGPIPVIAIPIKVKEYNMKTNQNSFGTIQYGPATGCKYNSTMKRLTVYNIPVAWGKYGLPIKFETRTVGVSNAKDFDFGALLNIICLNPKCDIKVA